MKTLLSFCAAIGAICLALPASGQLIDFETTPAATTPVDDAFLSTPYNLTLGGTVTFFFDVNANFIFDSALERAVFEAIGSDGNNGFTNNALSTSDTAQPGYEPVLGNFFLRQSQPGAPPPPFIVDYNTLQIISGLHGEIWDIDGAPGNTEGWQVDVLDSSNNVLASDSSPIATTAALDGLPWDFSFSGLPLGVDKVRITFIGSKTSGLGLAFNNFDPTNPVPEPSALAIAGIVAMGLISRRRHTRRL